MIGTITLTEMILQNVNWYVPDELYVYVVEASSLTDDFSAVFVESFSSKNESQ